MDTLQLVEGDRVQVYTLKKGINDTILYNEKLVLDRFNFKPEYLPDYKGLRGDPSDNIIGIKGIGEKTATILISNYHTVENLYKQIKKDESKVKSLGISDRILELLKNGEDEAMFSKTLATIRRDAPIDFKLPEKTWREKVAREDVASFFSLMEFKSLQGRFNLILDGKSDVVDKKQKTETNKQQEQSNLSDEDKEKIEKAKIALWLLNSEKTNPELDEILRYKQASSVDAALLKLEEDIKKQDLEYVYNEIEVPIIPIIKKMGEVGILIDQEYLAKISKEYHKDLEILRKSIYKMADCEFNLNSPKQLAEVIFDKMKIQDIEKSGSKKMKNTPGGARSTKESELDKLKDSHPIIPLILEYRELQKLLSTYIDTIPDFIGADGRLHASFIQTGATTGRFSSGNPNLQNIPIKTERGKNIRNAFIAKQGYVLASFDYSQIELRIAALMSQDSFFIKSFREGKDIHKAVAMKVFNVGENDVTADMRRRAKVINFGILYGMGVNALRQNLGGDRKEAQAFYDSYFAQFPTIAAYLESIKVFAREHGYTETLFGRKRYFPGIKSSIPFIKAMAERMATNAPIQGTATADIIKIGMRKAEDELAKNNLLSCASLILQVHDELVYEIKEDKVKEAMVVIENAMKNAIPRDFLQNLEDVPLEVTSAFGKNWGDLK
jgi:DNA polymerase-1